MTLVLLLLGALAGGFVSGLAGFGTALMALGIWLYVVPPSIAVPLVLICSILGQTSTLPSFWRSIDFKLGPDSSPGRCFGSHCSSCRQRCSAPGRARGRIAC
jgi:uncharacterized membrane protein YfcA